MFSRVLDNARALLSKSPSRSSLRHSSPVSPAAAAPEAMVTTRGGHDTNSPAVGSVTRSGRKRIMDDVASTPTRNPKKRRSGEDEDVETPKLGLSDEDVMGGKAQNDSEAASNTVESMETPKRGRGRALRDTKAGPEVVADTAVALETPAANEAAMTEPESADTSNAPEDMTEDERENESIYGTPATQGTGSVYATPATHLRPTNGGSVRPTPASVTPKPRALPVRTTPSRPSRLISSQTIEQNDEEPTPKADPAAQPPKSTHIRFGSEDPPIVPEVAPELPAKTEIPSSTADEESDDEAPEAVTATSAREQARVAEEDAAKAIEQQEAAAKRKRQERDARLRDQAASAKRRKQKDEVKISAVAVPPNPPTDVASSATITAFNPATLSKPSNHSFDLANIPALLPEDLLASAPAVRPRTPEPAVPSADADAAARKRQKLNTHLKFLDEKPTKDVKKGPVKVRVLEKGNRLLPPKVTSSSKSLRESWLAGRRGNEGKKAMFPGLERKKVGGGFLRK